MPIVILFLLALKFILVYMVVPASASTHSTVLVIRELPGLNNLQKIRDGEPLGGKASAESDFASDEDDDFLD